MPVPAFAQNYISAMQPKPAAAPAKPMPIAPKAGAIGSPAQMQAAQSAMAQKFGPPQIAKGAPRMMGGMGMKSGGKVKSASARADGCCVKGKTKGRMV